MPRPLQDLLERLERDVDGSDERRSNYESTRERADNLARALPLVHRTGHADDWRNVFEQNCLAASAVDREYERKAGRERSVYFFLGAGAFDKGHVALLLRPHRTLDSHDATFTPFDTGGMKFCTPCDGWNDDTYRRHLETYTGSADDLPEFAGRYIAAHFRVPERYVKAPQYSPPDFPAFHGLCSKNDDRRAWTVEVQCPDDVAISPDPRVLSALVIRGASRVLELPDTYLDRVTLLADDTNEEQFRSAIAEKIIGGTR